jgi:hypothetical protein
VRFDGVFRPIERGQHVGKTDGGHPDHDGMLDFLRRRAGLQRAVGV